MDIESKLELFSKNSTKYTQEQVEKELFDYEQALKNDLEKFKEKKEEELRINVNRQKQQLKNDLGRDYSNASFANKSALAKIRADLRAELFNSVLEKLMEHKNSEEYVIELNHMIEEVINLSNGLYTKIFLNKDDYSLKDKLKLPTNAVLLISENDILGGIRAIIDEKNIMIDKCYATILQEQRDSFYYEIGEGVFI